MFLALFFFLCCGSSIAADCYLRNGSVAVADNGQPYIQCPGYDFCCLGTDTCSGVNGLCQDVNNHNDGSLTGQSNYTGLYQTVACVNQDFEGCNEQCLPVDSVRGYIWACEDVSSGTYCCDDGSLTQFDCCNTGQNFKLGAAVAAGSEQSSTSSQPATSTSSTASSATGSATTTISAGAAASSSSTSTPSATNSPSSSGLSQGAKIGVGVGVAGGVLVLLVAGIILWRNHGRQKRAAAASQRSSERQQEVAQMEPYDSPPAQQAHQMYSHEDKPQLYTTMSPRKPDPERVTSELSGSREPQELPGNNTQAWR